jgi:hypothetical protein
MKSDVMEEGTKAEALVTISIRHTDIKQNATSAVNGSTGLLLTSAGSFFAEPLPVNFM